MYYVEVLYARRMLAWFLGIVTTLAILIVVAGLNLPGHVKVEGDNGSHGLPVDTVFFIAGYASCIMATMLAATLNRDRSHLAYMWTRPESREKTAIGYLVVDVIAILIAYLGIALLCVIVFAQLRGVHLEASSTAVVSMIRCLALPLMWYGLVEAATSWNELRGATVAGLSWAVFWGLLILRPAHLPAPFWQIVAILNFINPLAYFTTQNGHSITMGGAGPSTLILAYGPQTLIAYGIFLVTCAVAVMAWRRMET